MTSEEAREKSIMELKNKLTAVDILWNREKGKSGKSPQSQSQSQYNGKLNKSFEGIPNSNSNLNASVELAKKNFS